MTEAMQITVSSEMAKRIDDSNSTAARSALDDDLSSRPWVETVMRELCCAPIKKAGLHKKTRLGMECSKAAGFRQRVRIRHCHPNITRNLSISALSRHKAGVFDQRRPAM